MGLVGAPSAVCIWIGGYLDRSYSVGEAYSAMLLGKLYISPIQVLFLDCCWERVPSLLPLTARAHSEEFDSILISFILWKNKSQSEMLLRKERFLQKETMYLRHHLVTSPSPMYIRERNSFLAIPCQIGSPLPKFHTHFCTPFYYPIWSQGPCVAWPALLYLQVYSISSLTGPGSCRRKWSCGLGVWPEH